MFKQNFPIIDFDRTFVFVLCCVFFPFGFYFCFTYYTITPQFTLPGPLSCSLSLFRYKADLSQMKMKNLRVNRSNYWFSKLNNPDWLGCVAVSIMRKSFVYISCGKNAAFQLCICARCTQLPLNKFHLFIFHSTYGCAGRAKSGEQKLVSYI